MGVDIQTYRAKIGTYRHSYGIDVMTLVCVVNFSHGMKTVGCVLFIGILLIMAGVEQNPGPRELVASLAEAENSETTKIRVTCLPEGATDEILCPLAEADSSEPTKIRVTGLPEGATDEILCMFFENEHRQGGGKVRDVVVEDGGNSAIVDFEDTSAVDKVMQKQPITIFGTKVNVEVFAGPLAAAENSKRTKIRVTGLPEGATDEILSMFFENEHRQGGGKVREVTLYDGGKSAIVDFMDTSAVDKVMKKQPITILGTKVDVKDFDVNTSAENFRQAKLETIELPSVPHLIMRFENETRQGSGPTKDLPIDNDSHAAIGDFELPEVDKQTAELPKKRPPAQTLPYAEITRSDQMGKYIADHTRHLGDTSTAVLPKERPPAQTLPYAERTSADQMGTSIADISMHIGRQTPDTRMSQQLYANSEAVLTVNKQKTSRSPSVETLANADQKSSDVIDTTATYGTKHLRTQFDTRMGRVQAKAESRTAKKPTQLSATQRSEVSDADNSRHDQMSTYFSDSVIYTDIPGRNFRTSAVAKNQDNNEHKESEPKESEGEVFYQLLLKLGLANKYPGKISIQDVIAIDPNETAYKNANSSDMTDIPWTILKRLISGHSESRDMAVTDDKNIEDNIDLDNARCFISDVAEVRQELSPLDIFEVVFQCCEPLMKQIFFQKLYLCKIAVPFLYKHWETRESYTPVISVWPLRALAVENRVYSHSGPLKSNEVDLLELETKVVAFARFGRPNYSKSKLLNSLLSSPSCNTFFNIDCPSGMTTRNLSNGNIEMFWLPIIGEEKDKFQDAMTFLNMRGDLNENFDVAILSFIADFVDAITIIIDQKSIMENAKEAKGVLLNFSSVILLIADPLTSKVIKTVECFESDVTASKPGINIRVLSTHKGVRAQNVVDIVSSVSMHIKSHLKSNRTKSFQTRLDNARMDRVKTDEQDRNSEYGREEAEKLVRQMKKDGESRRWKHLLTPVHSTYSQQLGKLMKQREREKVRKESEKISSKIKAIREKQTQSITKTLKLFINILLRNEKSNLKLKLFLGWLHFYIEREKRTILPQLMYENRCAWEKLKTLKSKKIKVPSEIENQETLITQLEVKIDEASFSVEHFIREIGHVYEAILELKEHSSKFELPHVDKIARIIGNLVVDGHQFELIDGESFYMPYLWTKAVLKIVGQCIDTSRVMTLSVLGLQSSGKSTLLNTMFGSQFSSRTGRCTRGIHVQLVPVKTYEETLSPFNYVLIVDTEGLRSPELSHAQHEHDNELATVITGIGDVTMLNIMGENTSEIRDILQVIVHAFLRLKMTNMNLDIRKSCAFIHQNVADTSASEKMLSGLSKLVQTLDEMTKESARSEGILNISTFNQVIEFDISSQVWYLKNLWQGNPPMARVNNEYSEKIVDMKCKILRKALQMKNKSYKSLSDITEHAHSLWKGVLNEDFVFSFRNSLEIRAYMEMERVVQDELWLLESFIRDRLIDMTMKKFASCDQRDNLRRVADKLINDLNTMLADERLKAETVIKTYFDTNKCKDIIIQWKHSQNCRIQSLFLKLIQVIREQIDNSLGKRSVEILTVADHEKHEAELSSKSMEVANQFKNKNLNPEEVDTLFAKIWKSFVTKIDTTSYSAEHNRLKMRDIFHEYLINKFEQHHAALKEALRQSKDLTPILHLQKLGGSFQFTGIEENDINFSYWQRGKDVIKRVCPLLIDNAEQHVTKRVNQLFETVDGKIDSICRVNDEITQLTVNKFMHELDKSVHDIAKGVTECNFTTPFFVKIAVHISRYAHPVFDKHNENYFKTQGIAARLEQYRVQQKISFEAHLSNRKSEDIAAKLFSHVIEIFAEEWTSQNLSNRVTDELYSALPCVKNRVIIEICTDLLDKGNFNKFIQYLQIPKEFASLWITERANIHLFADKRYASLAASLTDKVFTTVNECVKNLKDCYIENTTSTMEEWINNFQKYLEAEDFSIQPESFRNVKKEVKQITSIEYLTSEILANLCDSEQKVRSKFSQQNSGSVKWTNANPIDRIIKKIWGCPEQCIFCGEPCAKNEDHDGSVHYSIQHRPSCCKGTYSEETKEAALESCEFDIQSNSKHKCTVFNFMCNAGTRESCEVKWHSYRDYKKYVPDWDIPPSSNMHDTSTFWMWFVATYKDELQKYYRYKVENIPSSWEAITKEEAKNSLLKTYST